MSDTNKSNITQPEQSKRSTKSYKPSNKELSIAAEYVTMEELFQLLNPFEYYRAIGKKFSGRTSAILNYFLEEEFIEETDEDDYYNVTILGALVLGNHLRAFRGIYNKSVKVIIYDGKTKDEVISEKVFVEGYLQSFYEIVDYIRNNIPENEELDEDELDTYYSFPKLVIEELLANLLIHQNLASSVKLTVEIFSDRIEFSNPGSPLVDVERILDAPAVTRNQRLASCLNRFGICKYNGKGLNRVVRSLIDNHMLAPKFNYSNNRYTKVTIYTKAPFDKLDINQAVNTCYMTAYLYYLEGKTINSKTIQELFELDSKYEDKALKLIQLAIDKNLIKAVDPTKPTLSLEYIPYWA